jgi:hypothetical protein
VLGVVGCKITVLFAYCQEKQAKILFVPAFLLTFATSNPKITLRQ